MASPQQRDSSLSLWLWALGLTLFFLHPLLWNMTYWGKYDWDYAFFCHEVARKTIVEYGQIPLWNPYLEGGQTFVGHIHNRTFTPDFLLILLFGTVVGLKLQVFLYFWLGLVGFGLLCRHWNMSYMAGLFGGLVFFGGGFFSLHILYGKVYFLPMALLPWLYLALLKTSQSLAGLLWLILLLAWLFFSGGLSAILLTYLTLAFFALAHSMDRRTVRPLLYFGAASTVAILLSAIKLFPLLEAWNNTPIKIYVPSRQEALGWGVVLRMFLSPWQGAYFHEGNLLHLSQHWHEYGAYIGWTALPLAFYGIWWHCYELRWHLLLALLSLSLLLGSIFTYSPWNLLTSIPIISQFFTHPSRWSAVVTFLLGIFAAHGLEQVRRRSPSAQLTQIGVCLLALELFLVQGHLWKDVFSLKPLAVTSLSTSSTLYQAIQIPSTGRHPLTPQAFDFLEKNIDPHWLPKGFHWRQASLEQLRKLYPLLLENYHVSLPYGANSSMFPALLAGRGVLNSSGFSFVLYPKATWSHQHPYFAWSLFPPLPVAHQFSPNRLYLRSPYTMVCVLNLNYAKGWKATPLSANTVQNLGGRLAVSISSSKTPAELYYWPESFLLGATLSFVTFYLLLTFFLWYRVQKKLLPVLQQTQRSFVDEV